jgi:hypothetical protein
VKEFTDPNDPYMIFIVPALDKAARGIKDHQLSEKLQLAHKLDLSWAQAHLMDTYLNAMMAIKTGGGGPFGYSFSIDQIKEPPGDPAVVKGIVDMSLYGSRVRYHQAQSVLLHGKEQEDTMNKEPDMNHLQYFTLLGRLHRDVVMAKWEDKSGRITDDGVRLLSSKVGNPTGIKDVAHMLSSILCAPNTHRNGLDAVLQKYRDNRQK